MRSFKGQISSGGLRMLDYQRCIASYKSTWKVAIYRIYLWCLADAASYTWHDFTLSVMTKLLRVFCQQVLAFSPLKHAVTSVFRGGKQQLMIADSFFFIRTPQKNNKFTNRFIRAVDQQLPAHKLISLLKT